MKSSDTDNQPRPTRRSFGRSAAVLGGTVALGLTASPASAATSETTSASRGRNASRAVAAYRAMQRQFYVPAQKLYHGEAPLGTGNPYSYVWPFSQATAATLDMLGLDSRYAGDVRDRAAGLASYYNPTPTSHNPPSPPAPPSPPGYASYVMPPLGGGGDVFYDDNEWLGLDGLQEYRMTGDTAALERAKLIFALVRYGWDSDTTHSDPGGTYWTQAPWSHDRNTISNGPGVEIGVRLYLLTKDTAYLEHSKRIFDWVDRYLKAPNGLYFDHVDLDGNVEKTQWSYNQGVMLGAAALLHLATGSKSYLDQASRIAAAALDLYGRGGRLYTQDVIFNAIFFKNLLFLHSIRPDGRYRRELEKYADTLWEAVDPSTGLLTTQPYKSVDLNVQAGLVQLQALLAWSPRDYHLLA
ncbi:MAG: glycoside hydrolase family 76 protein [Mycobacteriales bacterium]